MLPNDEVYAKAYEIIEELKKVQKYIEQLPVERINLDEDTGLYGASPILDPSTILTFDSGSDELRAAIKDIIAHECEYRLTQDDLDHMDIILTY